VVESCGGGALLIVGMVALVDGFTRGTFVGGCGSFALCFCFKPSLNSGKRAYCGRARGYPLNVGVLFGGRRWGRSEGGGCAQKWVNEGMALRPDGGYEMIERGSITFQGEEGLARA
jgi:hypothetical protein